MNNTLNIEKIILSSLLYNENFIRKSLPFFKSKYFENQSDKILYELIETFFTVHNVRPTKEILIIELDKISINQDVYNECLNILDDLANIDIQSQDLSWLLDQSEKFCQDKAIYNAIMDAIGILDGKGKTNLQKGVIPELLSQALSVSFDPNIGHDYIDNVDDRYEFYHRVEDRLEFDLEFFNKITKGGLPKKTLNICLAGTGVGKSLFMCHCAAAAFSSGKNVLYITMEMAEERIAERIDANLLNVPLDQLEELPKDLYIKKINKVRKKSIGKIIIKEYPTASASTLHFQNLLNELKLKKNFVPDIIFVDYLNICQSARVKSGTNVNSYTYVKAIAEELRGMAVQHNVPIVSATQTTRAGYTSTDLGLEDTSESFGLPATADFMFALISTEQLEELNQILVKQLKNRYNDPTSNKRFVIGVDRAKMRLYNVEQNAQKDLTDSGQSDEESEEPPIQRAGRFKPRKDFSKFVH